jgi:membrane protease YdiL (CAAX protease family)
LGIFAYGPLEMFFFVWLVRNTEQAFQGKRGSPLGSLAAMAVFYGWLHFIYQGFAAGLLVSMLFFMLGLIFQRTKNIVGPMIAWTLLNGQTLFLASMLWS